MSARGIQHVKELATGWVQDGITPAISALVVRKGIIVLNEGFGALTPDPGSPPLRGDSIFPLASLTKPITATNAMILVQDGLLGLNRPVRDYVPEFRGDGKDAVLVHHLLTHTSGLDVRIYYTPEPAKTDHLELPPCPETQHPWVHENLFANYDEPLARPPGEEMSYCNYNYWLLAEIVRHLSGKSLADFAKERIFDPLAMKDTRYIAPDSTKHRIVRRPSTATCAFLDEDWFWDTPLPEGGVLSTAPDMAIFAQMLLNGGTYNGARILSGAAVAAMTQNQIPGVQGFEGDERHDEASWAYGWSVRGHESWKYQPGTLMSPEAFRHDGAGGVYIWVDPTYELVGIYFSAILEMIDGIHMKSPVDLFANAVAAAIDD
jgi:CubicO group peptidase (beta-lactamase class C family)